MLKASEILLDEHQRTRWGFQVPADYTVDDLLNPLLLTRKRERFRAGDRIDMWTEGMTIYLEAVVVDVDPVTQTVSLAPLRPPVDLSNAPRHKADFAKATIEWTEGTRWRARYNHLVLFENEPSETAARERLAKVVTAGTDPA